ncbi:hypothetical protein RHGRI_017833 [Rhododendron griersonianum]|uniref:Uncharacterized protein n=1 Tax=Rhododendron griersonianum TaxID=479676 RepID=A0AAV6JZ92_9ERIC|nr:hypothetical protein RHGRI_017833 [Rhododendron griersonianum]
MDGYIGDGKRGSGFSRWTVGFRRRIFKDFSFPERLKLGRRLVVMGTSSTAPFSEMDRLFGYPHDLFGYEFEPDLACLPLVEVQLPNLEVYDPVLRFHSCEDLGSASHIERSKSADSPDRRRFSFLDSQSTDTVEVSEVDGIGCLGVVSKDPMVSSGCAATEFKVDYRFPSNCSRSVDRFERPQGPGKNLVSRGGMKFRHQSKKVIMGPSDVEVKVLEPSLTDNYPCSLDGHMSQELRLFEDEVLSQPITGKIETYPTYERQSEFERFEGQERETSYSQELACFALALRIGVTA